MQHTLNGWKEVKQAVAVVDDDSSRPTATGPIMFVALQLVCLPATASRDGRNSFEFIRNSNTTLSRSS